VLIQTRTQSTDHSQQQSCGFGYFHNSNHCQPKGCSVPRAKLELLIGVCLLISPRPKRTTESMYCRHQIVCRSCQGTIARYRKAARITRCTAPWSTVDNVVSDIRRLPTNGRRRAAAARREGLMQKQQRKLQSFGDDDRPSCPNCGKLTALTKRPDPDYNLRYLRYERRVFTCPACGQQTERIVEVAG
jgi:predicted RNA-binding Zn-ribbon protein involved in translation (DUF1610 family)